MKLTLSDSHIPSAEPDPLSNRQANRRVRHAALFAAGGLLYWALVTMIPSLGDESILLVTPFFVGAAGYFLGFVAGATASALAIIVHTMVLNGAGHSGPFVTLMFHPAAHAGILLLGPAAGRLRSRVRRLEHELEGDAENEHELRDAEFPFRPILENTREVFWIATPDRSKLAYVSPAFAQVFGRSPESLGGRPSALLELIHPQDRSAFAAMLRKTPGEESRLIYRVTRPNGELRWIETRMFAVGDKKRDVRFIAGISCDVTENKRASVTLAASERNNHGRWDEVLEKLAAGAPLADVLTKLAEATEALRPASVCSIEMYDRTSNSLRCAIAAHVSAAFAEMIDGAEAGPGGGCAGMAVRAGERVIVEDLRHCDLEPAYRRRVETAGIRACWSEPIRSSRGEMLGAFSVYLRDPLSPSPHDLELIRSGAELASIAIERHKIEVALGDNEERLRLFVEHSPAAVAVFDAGMRYLVASRKWVETYGLDGADVIGRNHDDVFPDMPERWKKACRRCLAGAVEHRDDDRIVRKDGSVDWVKWEMNPWRKTDGQVGGIIVFAEVVTEQRRARERLRRSEQQYRFLVDHMPDTITELDPDGNILFANRTASGQPVEEVVGTSVYTHVPEDRREEFRRCIAEAVVTRSPRDCTASLGTPSGPSWWTYRVVPVEENGMVVRLLVIGTDVSARKTAEDARRQSEEQYRSVFEYGVTGDFIATPEGRFTMCNPAFLRVFGFASREEALSVHASALFSDGSAWEEFVATLRVEHRLVDHERELRRKDGSVVHVIANFVGGFDQDGTLTEIKGYLFDNTARKRLEEQLLQAQKMEAIGRLAGGIAHDFNNSLTSISGYNELLLSKLDAKSPLYRYALEVMKASDRAAALTKRLLAFSRRQVIEPKIIDVNAVAHNMERVLRRTIGEDIALSTSAQADPSEIEADPSLIETAILNLAVNARDAMPEGGRLSIRTENVTVKSASSRRTPGIEPGRYVLVSIEDTGIGMDREIQSKIFEPFFTTKEQGRGTGLGLSTVYGAVSQSHGHVRVSSEPGKGATFELYFPLAEGRATASTSRQLFLGPSQGTETVLVAEDEPSVQRLIREVLEGKGYRVLLASNGEEALQVSSEHAGRIDLLIADIVMSGMNGREMAAQLKAKFSAMKVLYISGYIGRASVKIAELDGDTSFLSKPFSSEALARKTRLLLDSPSRNLSSEPFQKPEPHRPPV